MFKQISLRGSPCFVRPEHVAAVRASRDGESGAATIILASGQTLASPFDVEQLCARLCGQAPPPFDDEPAAPNSEQRAVIAGLYDRLNVTA